MIEGIKVKLKSDHLKVHLQERETHHRNKAVWYRNNANSFAEHAPATSINNSPAQDLERRAERHEALQDYFAFLAKHLIPDEEYLLDERDLTMLEFISNHYMQ